MNDGMGSAAADSPRSRRTLSACAATDPGRQREQNEDAHGLFEASGLFVVADGMGGRNGGDVAANLAVEHVAGFFEAQRRTPRGPWPFPMEKGRSLGANLLAVGLKVANQKIRAAAAESPSLHRMGATAAALAVGETQAVLAHVGDVRIYRLRSGALERLTRDHSVLEEVRAARPNIGADELAALAHRNVVTKALGTREDLEPTVDAVDLEDDDLFLLCCDGLWGSVDDQIIADILAGTPALDAACQTLVDAANQAGGPDNITALLVRVDAASP